RYTADGAHDTAFGDNGVVTADFGYYEEYGDALAFDADGGAFVTGFVYNPANGTNDLALVRLTPVTQGSVYEAAATLSVDVQNVKPVVSPLTLDAATLYEGGSVTVSGTVSDVGVLDTQTV